MAEKVDELRFHKLLQNSPINVFKEVSSYGISDLTFTNMCSIEKYMAR